MFYAGDDHEAQEAQRLVHQLAADLGFEPIGAGDLSQLHALEALASLCIGLAHRRQMGRGIAFHLLRRTARK
jgi:predicted dinucleotide-binding enzyme